MSNTTLYPTRLFGQRKWTGLFFNKNPNTVTYEDVQKFKEYLQYALHVENLSPKQIATRHNFVSGDFGTVIKNCFQLKLKDLKTAQKNTALQKGNIVTDKKVIYNQKCAFKLSQQDMIRIPGFDLLVEHGIYHAVKNPNGIVRDHILSRAEGYQKGYDPKIISHPANCQFITNADNIKKSSSSDITYKQLQERIALWDQQTPLLQVKERRKVPKSSEHIEKIRASINDRYAKIKSGELTITKNSGRSGRPETFSKKHDWAVINALLQTLLTLSAVSKQLNISYEDLKKAKAKGLIKKPFD
jgi:hypothetical protein